MNPITLAIAFFKVKGPALQIITEAETMNATTPGWKTSEFWAMAVTHVITIWGMVQGLIPGKYAMIITTAGTAVYTIARTAIKAYSTITASAPVSAPTVTVTTNAA
jgi:hypothetical protein